MRRIDYNGEEYLVHTRSGMRVLDAVREAGVPAECDCDSKKGTTGSKCVVKWPKDTAFLLTSPTALEKQALGDMIDKGHRLACQAMFK